MKKILIHTCLIASASYASAAIALVDFSDATSAGAGWDVIGSQGSNSDIAATALSTGWTIAADFSSVTSVGFGGSGINSAAGATITEAGAITDGIFISNNTTTVSFTFANLVAGTDYDFVAHTGRNGGGADATVAGQTSTWVAGGGQELSFTLQADGSGEIMFDFSSAGNNATFNALRIEGAVVPEPSSTALLGLGGLTLFLRRRR